MVNHSKGDSTERVHHLSKSGAPEVHYSMVTLGDLITAAYDVGGSTDAVTTLLRSPYSPLHHLINRQIVIGPG